jgi:hypothetical protein
VTLDTHVCPECKTSKHDACDGTAWCFVDDDEVGCMCALEGHGSR